MTISQAASAGAVSDIGPSTPAMSSPSIAMSLLSIAKSTRAFVSLMLAEIDLYPGQDQLIDRLPPGVSVSVSVLAQQLSVRASTVSKMLDRLVDRGLVVRSSDEKDARRTMVRLTDEGVQVQVSVRDVWQRLETDLSASLDADQLVTLAASLTDVDELLTRRLRRLR